MFRSQPKAMLLEGRLATDGLGDRQAQFARGQRCALARIAAAEFMEDNRFFEALGLAVRRSVTPHKGAKIDIAKKAAVLMDDGLSWEEAYDRLNEHGEIASIEPKEFYKLLQRHGVIPRRKRKS